MTNQITKAPETHFPQIKARGVKAVRRGLILLLTSLMLLSACGQKGPLYLPDNQTEQQNEGEEEATD